MNSGKQMPRIIRIKKSAATPSRYIIDARAKLQPWLIQETPPEPESAASAHTAPQKTNSIKKQTHEPLADRIFTALYVALHPKRNLRLLRGRRPEGIKKTAYSAPHGTLFHWTVIRTIGLPPWPRFGNKIHPVPPASTLPAATPAVSRIRTVLAFGLTGFVMLLPLQSLQSLSLFASKKEVEQQIASIQTQLQQGANPSMLTPSLFELVDSLLLAEKKLGVGNELLKIAAFAPLVPDKLQSDAALFEATAETARAIKTLTAALQDFPASATPAQKTERILLTTQELEKTVTTIEHTLKRLDAKHLPAVAQQYLPQFKKTVAAIAKDAHTISQSAQILHALLGVDEPARYLVVFQNSAELRATGGFIGSYGILDVKNGAIENFEIPSGGSYAVQGQLTAFLASPQPMHTINTRWEFQDSNWFPDFPSSAEVAARLYELSHGATVDGVIAVNSGLLETLVDTLGPIPNPFNPATELTKENIVWYIQDSIAQHKTTQQPKSIITAIAPLLMEKLMHPTPAQTLALVSVFNKARNSKELLVWSKNPSIQKQLKALAWDGSVAEEKGGDYLHVVHTNIGGGKTDHFMEERVLQKIDIHDDGTVTKRLTITRTHRGTTAQSGKNRDYLRVYVPRGSVLIAARGFSPQPEELFSPPERWYDRHQLVAAAEDTMRFDQKSGTALYKEFGKTVFANWVLTEPGQTSMVELEYELPRTLLGMTDGGMLGRTSLAYSLFMAKQPGVTNTEYLTSVIMPSHWKPLWLSDATIELGPQAAIHRTALQTDTLIGLIAAKN